MSPLPEVWPRSRRPGEEPGEYWPAGTGVENRSFRLTSSSPVDRVVAMLLGALLLGICLMCLAGVFQHNRPRESARRSTCRSNLRQMALACAMYADDNAGQMPDRLEALFPLCIYGPRVFSCPSCPSSWRDFEAGRVKAESSSYELVPGLAADMPGDTILAFDRQAANHRGQGRNVAFVDSHVEWLREDEFVRRLAEQAERVRTRAPVPERPEREGTR